MSGVRGEGARSVDRQITIQDVECLREAFSLFDPNRKDVITPEELGKVKKFCNKISIWFVGFYWMTLNKSVKFPSNFQFSNF